jgi:asparagine synthase (glutamine-hydrolysing)
MCGIAGIVGSGADRDLVSRMTERLRHRGPDDGDVWSAPGVALGHRRLSILDLSSAGHQPMTFGEFTIVFNGEIYNFAELRRGLTGPFSSNSDTEVLLKLYARDGAGCVDRLQGMFAFAIWNARTKTLFAARDRVGIKPLLTCPYKDGLAFASELKAFRELGPFSTDSAALADYFTYKYIPAPRTIYSGISKVPPAHTLTFEGGRVTLRRYWSPSTEVRRTEARAAAEELEALLHDCIQSHTVSDVPVGVFLSGGVDSTAIVSHLKRPKTFSIGFDIEKHSELPAARATADHFSTDHHEEIVSFGSLQEALDATPRMFDEPFGDSSGWATHVVSRVARANVKVALSGEGGDETFSGYGWYGKWLKLNGSRSSKLAAVLPAFSSIGRSFQKRAPDGLDRYAALIGLFSPAQQKSLLAPELVSQNPDPFWHFRAHWRPELDPVKRMQWLDLHTYLPDDLLVKADRASMAVALEVRPPLLDHRLVEFSLSLDSSLLRCGEKGKLLLRRVLEGKVPKDVLTRPKKGFSMPVRRWLEKEPQALDAALKRLAKAGVIRSAKRRRFDGEQSWSLLVLDRWMHP